MQMTHVTSGNGPTIRPEEMNSKKEKNKKKRRFITAARADKRV